MSWKRSLLLTLSLLGTLLLVAGCIPPQTLRGPLQPTDLPRVTGMALDPGPQRTIYLRTDKGAFVVEDREDGVEILSLLQEELDCRSMVPLPGTPRSVLIGTLFNGLYRSVETPSGRWKSERLNWGSGDLVAGLLYDEEHGRILAGLGTGIYVAEPDRLEFEPLESFPEVDTIRWIFQDRALPGTIQAVTFDGEKLHSTDGGETWEQVTMKEYLHSQRIKRDGIAVSTLTNQETSITLAALGSVVRDTVQDWDVDPQDTSRLLVVGYNSGLFRVTRLGSRWESFRTYPPVGNHAVRKLVSGVEFHPEFKDLAYMTTPEVVHRSEDRGHTWIPLWPRPEEQREPVTDEQIAEPEGPGVKMP